MSDQRKNLQTLLNTVTPATRDVVLSEILYTACETGILDFDSFDIHEAKKIWQMVELSRMISNTQINDIRM